ncbi:hypothetical protein AMTR_s00066p00102020 [Amborella trichopoda]|uniref:Uncharacterized protein n=1 Tax=Amborella trichopoda TaxID=13333 RepID=U5DHY8_AMBTC|nr:hypothetical protein AMTR_s00066p00102020 [Amborella trichopoda]
MSRSTAKALYYITGALWLQRLHYRSEYFHCRSAMGQTNDYQSAHWDYRSAHSDCRSAVLSMPKRCGSDKALSKCTL